MEYKWSLLTRSGTGHKQTCPNCGGHKCFRVYADRAGTPFWKQFEVNAPMGWLDDAKRVGKCDHDNSCAYNYTVTQFYKEHRSPDYKPRQYEAQKQEPLTVAGPLDPKLVTASRSEASTLVQYWRNEVHLPKEQLTAVLNDYRVGATQAGRIIYWMIDIQGRVKDGKFMAYKPNGHRYKEDDCKGAATYEEQSRHKVQWAFNTLMRRALQQQGITQKKDIDAALATFEVRRPYFGEHLLAMDKHRGKPVGLVEGEKSALICSTLMPQYVWLAIGTSAPNEDRLLQAIKQRRQIHLFPDLDQLERINRKVKEDYSMALKELLTVEDTFIQMHSQVDNDDIGDILLRFYEMGNHNLEDAVTDLLTPGLMAEFRKAMKLQVVMPY